MNVSTTKNDELEGPSNPKIGRRKPDPAPTVFVVGRSWNHPLAFASQFGYLSEIDDAKKNVKLIPELWIWV